jgi:hypothetical protein
LVVRLLEDKNPSRIQVVGADDELWGYFSSSAKDIGKGALVVKGEPGVLVSA